MTLRENEAVAVTPGRIPRVDSQDLKKQGRHDVRRAKPRTDMSGLRPVDHVHDVEPDFTGNRFEFSGPFLRYCRGQGNPSDLNSR